MSLRIYALALATPGQNLAPVPEIMVANQPRDRRTIRSTVTGSVVVALTPNQLAAFDPDGGGR